MAFIGFRRNIADLVDTECKPRDGGSWVSWKVASLTRGGSFRGKAPCAYKGRETPQNYLADLSRPRTLGATI